MTDAAYIRIRLAHGDEHPYDAPDDWMESDDAVPPPPKDWAHRAARGILADLCDRRGIKQELRGIDEEIRTEITETLADVIRVAKQDDPANTPT